MSISQTVSYAQNFSPLPRFHYIALHQHECTTSNSGCSSAHQGASLEWKKVQQGDAASYPRATAVVQQLQEWCSWRAADTQWEGATLGFLLLPHHRPNYQVWPPGPPGKGQQTHHVVRRHNPRQKNGMQYKLHHTRQMKLKQTATKGENIFVRPFKTDQTTRCELQCLQVHRVVGRDNPLHSQRKDCYQESTLEWSFTIQDK